jgi:hypothetical protein
MYSSTRNETMPRAEELGGLYRIFR